MTYDQYPGSDRLLLEANLACRKKKWKRDDLAERVGCCKRALQDKLSSPGHFTVDEFCAFCKSIGIAPEDGLQMILKGGRTA